MKDSQDLTARSEILDSTILSDNENIQGKVQQKIISVKCINDKKVEFVCINKYCQNKPAFLCAQVKCLCRNQHKRCIHSSVKSFIETIQEIAFPLKNIKDKINKLFDDAIDKLSQKRESFMSSFKQLFVQKSYTANEREFLQQIANQSNKKITGKLMSEIYATLYDRQAIDKPFIPLITDLQRLQTKIQNAIDKFIWGIKKNLVLLEKNILGESKERKFHLFMNSSIILESKQSDKLMELINIPIEQAKMIFKASDYGFKGDQFHKLCEDKQKILVLIMTQNGKVIGGYTPYEFSSKNRNSWVQDIQKRCFIFSLTQNDKLPLTMYKYATNNYSVDKETILKFGDDIVIGNLAQKNLNSSTQLNDSYKHEKYPDNIEGYLKFTGSDTKQFLIEEWQVWKID